MRRTKDEEGGGGGEGGEEGEGGEGGEGGVRWGKSWKKVKAIQTGLGLVLQF